ncbi:hypothetical protein ILUMI_18569, partial [Ignelater luminosus]
MSRADEKIVGGHSVPISEFKYQAALEVLVTGLFCGACIISPKYVLTAGHCGAA